MIVLVRGTGCGFDPNAVKIGFCGSDAVDSASIIDHVEIIVVIDCSLRGPSFCSARKSCALDCACETYIELIFAIMFIKVIFTQKKKKNGQFLPISAQFCYFWLTSTLDFTKSTRGYGV